MNLSRIVPTSLLAAAIVVTGAPAHAGGAAESVTVIARKLDNPRGIAVGPHGHLLVAEAGKGGKGPCIPSPENPAEQVCLGLSSAVTAVAKHDRRWKQHRIVTGLPSIAGHDGSGALGLHDLAPTHHGLFATIGGAATPETRAKLGPRGRLLGHVVVLYPKRRVGVKAIADLNRYEARHNPDAKDPGSSVDSNPYGILAARHGLYVVDAGGNDLLAVNKKGKVSTVAVFRTRMVDSPAGIPNLPPQIPMQSVPTTVARGPDGALYVGELTGFPFKPGAARIWRIESGKKPKVYATGFTNVVDIAFDRKGRLLVLQISKKGLLSNDPTGALYRLEKKGGKRVELAAGKLTMPGGVVVGRDGAIYVTNKSVTAGGGEVLRITA